MAMLLAMYQKMRLIREKNETTLDLTRFTSKYNRVSKNIEKVQKMYTSKIAALESQAKIMQSQAKSIFQQNAGLTMDSQYLNPNGYGQINGFIMSRMQDYCNTGFKYENGKLAELAQGETGYKFGTDLSTLYQLYTSGKLNSYGLKAMEGDETRWAVDGIDGGILKDDVTVFQMLMNAANGEYSQRTMAVNQMSSNYETNVSIWLQAEKDRLEAEQDEAVEPLTYQQTMWELEKEQAEQKLERIKADLESYKQLCSEEAKEAAPKFGLH